MDEPSQLHISGPTLTVDGVRRQRCVWCGALLSEIDLGNISRPLESGEDPDNPAPWEPASWAVGAQVRLSGTSLRIGEVVEPEMKDATSFEIPDDSCMAIHAEMTR